MARYGLHRGVLEAVGAAGYPPSRARLARGARLGEHLRVEQTARVKVRVRVSLTLTLALTLARTAGIGLGSGSRGEYAARVRVRVS